MGANAGAIRGGRAFVEFVLSDKKLKAQLRSIQARFQALGSGLRQIGRVGLAAGGAITSAFAGAAKVFADTGSRLADMSARTGLSAESLSELDHAASMTGTSLETVETAIKHLQKKGIDPKQFDAIANGIAAIEDPTERAQKAMESFGKKAGTQLLPMLADLAALRQEARDLGIVMSSEDAAAADELGDAMDALWSQLKGVVVSIGAAVAGPLTDFLHMTQPILRAVIDWVKNNWPLIRTIAAIGLAVGALGGVLFATGIAFTAIGVAVGGLVSAIGLIGTVLGAVISPAGLVVAAIAGGVTAFALFTNTGQGMVQSLVDGFAWLKDTVLVSLGAMSAALSAGDFAAAGKVLWATLQLLWLQGTQGLRETWHSLVGGITKVWHVTWAGMLQLVNAAWGNLERGWSHTTEFFANTWDSMIGGIKRAWNTTVAFFEKTWLRIKGLFGSDVQGEIDRINSELEIANKKISGDTASSRAGRSQNAAANRNSSRKLQDGTLDVIGQELAAKLSGTDEATKQKIAAAQRQLEESRNAWKESTAAAQAVGDAAAAQKASVKQTGNDIAKAASGSSSMGTFSADAVAALQGGSSAEEETAKNTRETAKQVGELVRAFSTGNLFGLVAKQ